MDSTDLYQHILGLRTPWSVTRVEIKSALEEIHVYVDHAAASQFCCPECDQKLGVYDHTSERIWRHLDTCQMKTFLHAKPPRVQCPKHKTRQVLLPWAEPGSGFTALFERFAIDLLLAMSAARTQSILRVTAEHLYGIKSRAVDRGLSFRDANKVAGTHPILEHGCVDEKSWKRGRQFGTIVCNVKENFVEDVYEGRAGNGLGLFYDGLSDEAKSHIQSMSQDFHAGYSSVTVSKLARGKEIVVFDRFHLMMHANEGVAATHRKELAQTRSIIKKGEKHSPKSAAGSAALSAHFRLKDLVDAKWSLLRAAENRTEKQVAQTAWAAQGHYESAEAWRFKETLRATWSCTSVEDATLWLENWCSEVLASSVQAMHKVAKMVKKHAWGILNGLRMQISNSPAETMNSKIQTLRCKARGHSNFKAFKNDVLFHLGGLNLYPRALNA